MRNKFREIKISHIFTARRNKGFKNLYSLLKLNFLSSCIWRIVTRLRKSDTVFDQMYLVSTTFYQNTSRGAVQQANISQQLLKHHDWLVLLMI